jgi:hypothetical protein
MMTKKQWAFRIVTGLLGGLVLTSPAFAKVGASTIAQQDNPSGSASPDQGSGTRGDTPSPNDSGQGAQPGGAYGGGPAGTGDYGTGTTPQDFPPPEGSVAPPAGGTTQPNGPTPPSTATGSYGGGPAPGAGTGMPGGQGQGSGSSGGQGSGSSGGRGSGSMGSGQ